MVFEEECEGSEKGMKTRDIKEKHKIGKKLNIVLMG